MRVDVRCNYRQALILLLPLAFFSCRRGVEEVPVIPPPTNPMVREFIGYGVVNVSFIHLLQEPFQDNLSLGFLRKGSLVKITERRFLKNRGSIETWLEVEAEYSGAQEGKIQGWLRESSVNVYDNEFQAITAAGIMLP